MNAAMLAGAGGSGDGSGDGSGNGSGDGSVDTAVHLLPQDLVRQQRLLQYLQQFAHPLTEEGGVLERMFNWLAASDDTLAALNVVHAELQRQRKIQRVQMQVGCEGGGGGGGGGGGDDIDDAVTDVREWVWDIDCVPVCFSAERARVLFEAIGVVTKQQTTAKAPDTTTDTPSDPPT
jgi:hypothetical protein